MTSRQLPAGFRELANGFYYHLSVINQLRSQPCPLPLQVLSTRVYRGTAPISDGSCSAAASHSTVWVAAVGGTAKLESGEAWELCSCWQDDEVGQAVH
jgi:hypothetical protein